MLSSKVSSPLHSFALVEPMPPTPPAPTLDAYQAAKDADKIAAAAAIAARNKHDFRLPNGSRHLPP